MSHNDELSGKLGPPVAKRTATILRSHHRLSSSHIPDRLKGGDDQQEDFAALPPPPHGNEGRESRIPFGVFSVLAAAGTRSEFYPRIDASSDSEGEGRERSPRRRFWERDALGDREIQDTDGEGKERGRARLRRKPTHRIFKNQSLSGSRQQNLGNKGPQSRTEPALPLASGALKKDKSAEFRGGLEAAKSPERHEPQVDDFQPSDDAESPSATLLATRIKKVFDLEKVEKVIAEYQCWLLQSILLQGYMYVTERHICFYAYLPKKAHSIIKSGYLSKRGKQNPKYNRYWFALKGNVLSHYLDPSNLYFPSGHVDLRHAISANLVEDKDKDKVKDFVVTTEGRTYQFRADSAPSAKEWVKTLQKVIFRSHNEGDSVKIRVPIENVIDIEDNPMLDYAETCKIRVLESGDSYAIDEVCNVALLLNCSITNSG